VIKLFDIVAKTSTGIHLRVDRQLIPSKDLAVYAVYDTSTGVMASQDYYQWRVISEDTPDTVVNYRDTVDLVINNTNIYPTYQPNFGNYLNMSNHLLKLVTLPELDIFNALHTRVDMVRKRLPNPGTVINDTDGVGDGGVVGYAGGYDKKFSVDEYFQFITGALIEINVTSPATTFWWSFVDKTLDLNPNPYLRNALGVPTQLHDLIVQAGVIRALVGWGLLEVDLNFNTVDAGLSITFDRSNQVQGWMNNLLNEYTRQLRIIKWDFANSYGVGLGSTPYLLMGLWGKMAGLTQQSGTLAINSLLGYGASASRPL